MNKKFTLDGSEELERQLSSHCAKALAGVQETIPSARLEALVLGGGYGRGQGGVLRTESGERPYNDMEFYVFLHGNRLLNERRYRTALNRLGDELSPSVGLHIEFKIESSQHFRRAPVSMFSYDLVTSHRIIAGYEKVFDGCAHHKKAENIPLSEATRLLFNRCTGLLLVREILQTGQLTPEQIDFVGRNLAKAKLALGDAVLTAFGLYHWECLKRHRRLISISLPGAPPNQVEIRALHAAGVEFKLHPSTSIGTLEQFSAELRRVAQLGAQLWLWLESRRLKHSFASIKDYAFDNANKCRGTPGWRNYLINVRAFGWRAALHPFAPRYPRERLFNALSLLLWTDEISSQPAVQARLKSQLHSTASDWQGLLAAYKRVWPSFG